MVRRAVAVVCLLGLLLGLCVWYGATGPTAARGVSPDTAEMSTDRADDLVALSGRVVDTDPVTILVTSGREPIRMQVTDLSTPVDEGDTLRVVGDRVDRETIRAVEVIVVHEYGFAYTYTVSFVAGLWVLVRLARYWRYDLGRGAVRRVVPLGGSLTPFGRPDDPVTDGETDA